MKNWQIAGLLAGGAALAYVMFSKGTGAGGGTNEGLNGEMGIVRQNGQIVPLYPATPTNVARAGSVMVNNVYLGLNDYFYWRFWLNLKPTGEYTNVTLDSVRLNLTKSYTGPGTLPGAWIAGTETTTGGRPLTAANETWVRKSLPMEQFTVVDLMYRDNLAPGETPTVMRPFSVYDTLTSKVIRQAILEIASDYANLTPGTYTLTCTCAIISLTYSFDLPSQPRQTSTIPVIPAAVTATFTIVVGSGGSLIVTIVGSTTGDSGTTPPPPPPPVTALFSANLETGDLTPFTRVLGTPAVVSSPTHGGSWALRTLMNDYVTKEGLIPGTTCYTKFYISLGSALAEGTSVILATGTNSTNERIWQLWFEKSGGVNWLSLMDIASGWKGVDYVMPSLVAGVWYCFEVKQVIGTNGSIELFVDGASKGGASDIDNSSAVEQTGTEIGQISGDITGYIYYDDIVINSTHVE